jgi:plastocyanin
MRSVLMLFPLAALLACGGSDSTSPGTGGGGGGGGGGTTPVATTAVDMKNSAFNPANIKVAPSATVNFTNSDGINHNVTFASTAVTSVGNFASGTQAVTMPAAAGTYTFRCTLHAGMSGSVLVQ